MKFLHRTLGALSITTLAFMPLRHGGRPDDMPDLVVLMVVDQLRADLLERYDTLFTGGFRRLSDEGLRFTNARHDHALTNSSPGHATLATGSFPAAHGIVDNSWIEYNGEGWDYVSSVADSTVYIVDHPEIGGVSPRARILPGIGDWIAVNDADAAVVAIGQGTASTMSLSGKSGGHAYWSSSAAGGFVTSSYFRETYPTWVRQFNQEMMPRYLEDSVWDCTVPPEARGMAREDSVPYENDGLQVAFPHVYGDERGTDSPEERKVFMEWFRGTPMHDAVILAFARSAIDSLQLGQRETTDYLGVNLSSLDDVGHAYGPRSLEQLDALLRLDRALGEFFSFLDTTVGVRNYVVVVAGDHGVADAPEYGAARGGRQRRVTLEEVETLFDSVMAIAEPTGQYSEEVANRVSAAVERFDFVADAMTHTDLTGPMPADSFIALYRNSYRSDRHLWFPLRSVSRRVTLDHFGVTARLQPWAMVDYATAIHGSPYSHDRRVGLVLMGAGVQHGTSVHPVRSVDVAPTLAELAGIPVPEHVDGAALFCARCEDAGGEAPLFEAVREGELVTDGGLSRGVAWGDYDNDGDPDLVVANTINWPQFLYRNDGDGSFTEIHEVPITLAVGWTEGVQWIDYDNDGDLDLYQTNSHNQPNGLFRNTGSGDFVRIAAGELTGDSASSTMSCWADVDQDGDLDAFVVNRDGQPDALYRNKGAGEFERLRGRAPGTDAGHGRACVWVDVDDDGDVDLYVGNANERNYFYRNDGSEGFSDVTEGDFVTAVAYTYGVSAADYDNDGDADLFVSNVNERNVLYRNDGNGRFNKVTDSPVVSDSGGASKGNTWGDFDNDGDLDLFVANGTNRPDMRNFVYLNQGDGRFVRLGGGPVTQDADTSAGAAWADYDMDGDLDLFVANWGGSDEDNALYRNMTSGRSWVSLRTVGRTSNRQGVGAKVRIKAVIGGRAYWQTRWVIPHTGYASQNMHEVHFGLGDATRIDSLEIRWPSGQLDAYARVEPNRFLVVTEGEAWPWLRPPMHKPH